MSSSIKAKTDHETLEALLLDNDFFEIALREEQERLRRAREAAIAANKPKISEEDLAQAEATGYAQGLADGKQQATEALRGELNQHLGRLIERLQYLDAIKQEYLRITYTAAFKLLGKMVDHLFADISRQQTEDVLAHALKTCLDSAVADVPLMVRLNPATLDYARKIAGYDAKIKAFEGRIKFIPDQTVTAGDCLLEWDAAGVDVRLSHAVDDIKKLLAGKLAGIQREDLPLPPDPVPAAPQAAPLEHAPTEPVEATDPQPDATPELVTSPPDPLLVEAEAALTDSPPLPDVFEVEEAPKTDQKKDDNA